MKTVIIQNKLAKHNISSFKDLDNYIKNNIRINKSGEKYYMSRFGALTELLDKETAHIILYELSINQL